MRKIFLTAVVLLILALDWAALDDITTGKEPDYNGEYAIIILSLLFFGGLICWWFTKKE